jgi:hypothetical protein
MQTYTTVTLESIILIKNSPGGVVLVLITKTEPASKS